MEKSCLTKILPVLCVLLLTLASCSPPQTEPAEVAGISEIDPAVMESRPIPDSNYTSDVIIALGDKKLTRQQVSWLSPNASGQAQIAKVANWWLETELLYAEAQKRNITDLPRPVFLADIRKKETFAKELIAEVRISVDVNDEQVMAYYEQNKDTDPLLKREERISFSHIKTETIEQANAALERINAGQDIHELAEELSIHRDAEAGGKVREYTHPMVVQLFGDDFFQALSAASQGQLIGPITTEDNAYEIARHDGITEERNLSLTMAKHKIRLRLRRSESNKAVVTLLESLKEKAADKIVRSPSITQTDQPTDSNQ
ncbi:MAG: peptidylprolyl isomerase [Planctomycetota bacterium]